MENYNLIQKISQKNLEEIIELIKRENLGYGNLQKEQFIMLKSEDNNIAGFGRIYNEKRFQLLGSIWVNKIIRGDKIGYQIINELIKTKKDKNKNLYLFCFDYMEKYYNGVGFKKINRKTFEKKLKSKGFNYENVIVMKYDQKILL